MPDQVRHDGHKLSPFLNYDTVCFVGMTIFIAENSPTPELFGNLKMVSKFNIRQRLSQDDE